MSSVVSSIKAATEKGLLVQKKFKKEKKYFSEPDECHNLFDHPPPPRLELNCSNSEVLKTPTVLLLSG